MRSLNVWQELRVAREDFDQYLRAFQPAIDGDGDGDTITLACLILLMVSTPDIRYNCRGNRLPIAE